VTSDARFLQAGEVGRMSELSLFPVPQQLERRAGAWTIGRDCSIVLTGERPHELSAPGLRIRDAIERAAGVRPRICAGYSADDSARPMVQVQIDPRVAPRAQGYVLEVDELGARLIGSDAPGLFYATCTLAQVIDQTGGVVPGLRVADWPDFAARGVMLDISRDKVPDFDTLTMLVDSLARLKINQLQLYSEHTFAYRDHSEVWRNASPLTGDEVMALDAYCRERFVELVPNQNSLGHMERWLAQPRYRHLAEYAEGAPPRAARRPAIAPTAPKPYGSTLCPTDPNSVVFLRELYRELLPHFSSTTVNVGCDEPSDIIHAPGESRYGPVRAPSGRSAEICQTRGAQHVYADFIGRIHEVVGEFDHKMQIWGDVIAHYPEIIPEIPRDVTVLDWGYDASYPFAEHLEKLADAGLTRYVCPGTSAWGSIGGRTRNTIDNLRSAAEAGLAHSAAGYLNTDWGTDGHRNFLSVSFLGYAVGAAFSWSARASAAADTADAVSRHAFGDASGTMGRVAYDLGAVADPLGAVTSDSTILGQLMRYELSQLRTTPIPLKSGSFPSAEGFHRTLDLIDESAHRLASASMARPDAAIIRAEYELTIRLLRHACWRGLLGSGAPDKDAAWLAGDLDDLMARYEAVWLARNRVGGLADSMARLARLRDGYRQAAAG
jgi:hypothetical protein